MRFATEEDRPEVERILIDSWDNVSDDHSDKENIYFDPSRTFSFIDKDYIATVLPITHVLADCHITSKSDRTVDITLEAMDYLKSNSTIRSLLAHVPINNPKCSAFAEKVGFTYLGINRKSFLKNGNLIDQYVYTRCL